MPIGIYKPGGGYTDADVAAYLTAQGITALGSYDYIQVALPTSPSVGERWMQVLSDGSFVESWYVEPTGTLWVSETEYSQSSNATTPATGARDIPLTMSSTSVYISEVAIQGRATSNYDSVTNNYRCQFRHLTANASVVTIGTELEFLTNSNNTFLIASQGIDLLFPDVAIVQANFTRTGTATGIFNFGVKFRSHRPVT